MLNKKKNNKIKTYETEHFDIYITTTKENYRFELRDRDSNRINFEFGVPIEQQSYEVFLKLVERNLGDAIIWYVKDAMEYISTLILADRICDVCVDHRLNYLSEAIEDAREYLVSEEAYDEYCRIKTVINETLNDEE